ncbi:MAG: hypothetical protein ABR865_14130, partial [Terracidiphilus sp.]
FRMGHPASAGGGSLPDGTEMGASMRVSFRMPVSFRMVGLAGLVAGCSLAAMARIAAGQAAQGPSGPVGSATAGARAVQAEGNPVADPKAVVTIGYARFTVLTPQLIRIECDGSGKFEDHASFVFINRRLPVPKFEKSVSNDGRGTLTIKTDALTLTYTSMPDYKPTPGGSCVFKEELSIALNVDGKQVVWHPGLDDPDNLMGTTRTLDTARGSKTEEPIEQGLVSRAGWALVDDSTRPLFDSADFRFPDGEKSAWPWVMERPANEKPGAYTDWYFFGYGHDYRKALGDFVRVAGRIPLPPRFAFGVWWSRYWAYTDGQLDDLVRASGKTTRRWMCW